VAGIGVAVACDIAVGDAKNVAGSVAAGALLGCGKALIIGELITIIPQTASTTRISAPRATRRTALLPRLAFAPEGWSTRGATRDVSAATRTARTANPNTHAPVCGAGELAGCQAAACSGGAGIAVGVGARSELDGFRGRLRLVADVAMAVPRTESRPTPTTENPSRARANMNRILRSMTTLHTRVLSGAG
jgi:hypothetical protein